MDNILEDVLPNALMMGVDYDLFWELNPKSLSPFIKAFSLRQQENDFMAWQHGLYVKYAIASSFGNEKYPAKPFSSKTKDKPMTAEEIKMRMMGKMKLINSQFGKE